MSVGTIGAASGLQPAMPDGAVVPLANGKSSRLWENVTVSLSPGTYIVSGSGASHTFGVKFFAPNSKTAAVAFAGKPATLRVTKNETMLQVSTVWTSPASTSQSNVRIAYGTSQYLTDTGYLENAGYVTPDLMFTAVRNLPGNNGVSRLVKTDFADVNMSTGDYWTNTPNSFNQSYQPQSLAVSPVTGNFVAGAITGQVYFGSTAGNWSMNAVYNSDERFLTASWCKEAADDNVNPFVIMGQNSSGYATYSIITDPKSGNQPSNVSASRNQQNSWTKPHAYMYDAATRSYYFTGGYMSWSKYNVDSGSWNHGYVDSSVAGTGVTKSGSTFIITSTNNRIYTSTDYSSFTYHTPTLRLPDGSTGTLSGNTHWAGLRKEGDRITIWTADGEAYYQETFSTSGVWERAEVADLPMRNGWIAMGGGTGGDWSTNRSYYANLNEPVPTIHGGAGVNQSTDSYTRGSLKVAPLGITYAVYQGA